VCVSASVCWFVVTISVLIEECERIAALLDLSLDFVVGLDCRVSYFGCT
jgi:hypothetical protein